MNKLPETKWSRPLTDDEFIKEMLRSNDVLCSMQFKKPTEKAKDNE